jgi:DNA-binding transcriptional LysR family regulator
LSEVSLTRMSKREQINAVKDGRIHIGFARYYAPESDIAVEKIAEEQLYIAVPQDIPLASKADVTMAEIADMPLVLFPAGDRPSFADAVLMAFSEIGLTPQVNGTATDSTFPGPAFRADHRLPVTRPDRLRLFEQASGADSAAIPSLPAFDIIRPEEAGDQKRYRSGIGSRIRKYWSVWRGKT